jgi:hypothetical protein
VFYDLLDEQWVEFVVCVSFHEIFFSGTQKMSLLVINSVTLNTFRAFPIFYLCSNFYSYLLINNSFSGVLFDVMFLRQCQTLSKKTDLVL